MTARRKVSMYSQHILQLCTCNKFKLGILSVEALSPFHTFRMPLKQYEELKKAHATFVNWQKLIGPTRSDISALSGIQMVHVRLNGKRGIYICIYKETEREKQRLEVTFVTPVKNYLKQC